MCINDLLTFLFWFRRCLEGCRMLQKDLDKIRVINKMNFNIKKYFFAYTDFAILSSHVCYKKDLMGTVNDKLSFKNHINEICRKSYQMLALIFRRRKYFSSQTKHDFIVHHSSEKSMGVIFISLAPCLWYL